MPFLTIYFLPLRNPEATCHLILRLRPLRRRLKFFKDNKELFILTGWHIVFINGFMQVATSSNIKPIAQAGLVAKGIVYIILGALAFMAAFHIGDQTANNTGKEDVFGMVAKQTGGKIMLAVLAVGLLCYSTWRMIQTFRDTEDKGSGAKGIAMRLRYFFSGLVYVALAFYAFKMLFEGKKGGDNKQGMVQQLLNKPFGEWLLGIVAIIILIIGIYQCFYGFSEKFRKHLNKAANSDNKTVLRIAGKVGYVARGIVWLIIGGMFGKAALYSNSSEAGDTSKAFSFLADAAYGTYLLAAVGLGLVGYGIFNFIRARHERFHV